MFTGDIGSALVLYLGASLITVLELIDVLFSRMCRSDYKGKKKPRRDPAPSHLPTTVRGTPVIQYETISQQPPPDMYHQHHNITQNHVLTRPPDSHPYAPTRTHEPGNGLHTLTSPSSKKFRETSPRVHFANTDI